MSFEPLRLKLIDRRGQQVTESIQTTVVQAFEHAVTIPDADISDLVAGAARVARVIADGDADQPERYAASVLDRIAWKSQRDFLEQSRASQFVEIRQEAESLEDQVHNVSAIHAALQIQQLLQSLNKRDRTIVILRSRGFRYEEIAREVGMLVVSVRTRYYLAKTRLQKLAADKR